MAPAPRDSAPTAVLLVHGIGAQERGDTLAKIWKGLRKVAPDALPTAIAEGETVALAGQPLRFYEVYWADLLRGEVTRGAFQIAELQSIPWFPWFHHRRKVYAAGDYGRFQVLATSLFLPVVNLLLVLAYYGARVLAIVVAMFVAIAKRGKYDPEQRLVDAMLDEYVGDVFHYVNSAGEAYPRPEGEPPVPPEVEGVYLKIIERSHEQLLRAQDDGCAAIQVVAHSLGTVVAFHALTGLRAQDDPQAHETEVRAAIARVEHLYTIGSPLEKIRFFWPKLQPAAGEAGGAQASVGQLRFLLRPRGRRLAPVRSLGRGRQPPPARQWFLLRPRGL
ncbi:MAG TPA: hypothetical protein VGC54_13005 [Planctomycetota bacterium]